MGGQLGRDAFRVGIDVERSTAEEADEGLPAFASELDGETGGGGDSADDGDASGEGFLEDFEGGAAADEEEMLVEGERAAEETGAEGFVDGVMTADVFAEDEEAAERIEDGGGVEAAGAIEGLLCGAHAAGQIDEGGGRECEIGVDGWKSAVDGIDGSFAAEATA
jgi:hypothetical protein